MIPGDVTLVYYVDTGKFLCHEGCKPLPPGKLTCHRLNTWSVTSSGPGGAPDVMRNKDETRAHLCCEADRKKVDEREIRRYYEYLDEGKLPHFGTDSTSDSPE